MKKYDKNKISAYLKHWDVNHVYGLATSQKFLVNNFEWIYDTSEFNEDFIKDYNEESDEGYFQEPDIPFSEKSCDRHNYLPLLPERMEIGKAEKLVINLPYKTEYIIHIRNLKQALNQELLLKRVHRVIKFNQNVWLKPDIDLNTKLQK